MTEYASLSLSVDSREVDKATRGLADLEKAAGRTEAQVSEFGRKATIAFAAVAAGAAAFATGVIRNTIESENAIAQLTRGVELSAGRVGRTVEQLQEQAKQLQSTTLFSDEQVTEAQSRLLSFQNVAGDVFDRAIRASADLAQRMGTDLNSAALQLGKALQEPETGLTALTRSGTTFSKQQKELIKDLVESGRTLEAQSLILDELERQYEGSARAARETFGGAITGLKNQLGELLEAGNGKSLEDARLAIERLTTAISDPEFVEGAAAVSSGVISIAASLATMLAGAPRVIEFLNELENAFVWGDDSDSVAGIQIRIDSLNSQLETLRNQERVFGEGSQETAIANVEAELAKLEARQRSLIDAQTAQIIKAKEAAAAAALAAKAAGEEAAAKAKAAAEEAAAAAAAENAAEAAAKQIEKLNQERERERQAIQAIVDATNPYQAKQRELIAQIATLEAAIKKETGSTDQLTKAKAALERQLDDLRNATRDAIKGHEDTVEQLTKELEAIRQGEDAYRRFTVEQEVSEETRRRIVELQQTGIELTDAEISQIGDLTRAEINLRDQIDREAQAREDANRAWQGFVTEIAGAFIDSTGSMGDAFTDLLGRLKRELINSGVAGLFGFEQGSTPILSGLGQLFGSGSAASGGGLSALFSGGKMLPGFEASVIALSNNLVAQGGMLADVGLALNNTANSLAKYPGGFAGGSAITAGAGFAGGYLGGKAFGVDPGYGSAIGGIAGAIVGGPVGAAIGSFAGAGIDKLIGGDGPETRAAVFLGADAGRAEQKHTVARLTGASGLTFAGEAQRVGEEGTAAVTAMTEYLARLDTLLTQSARGAGFGVDLAGATFGKGSVGVTGDAARDFVRTWIDQVSRGFDDELEMAAAALGGKSADQLAAGFDALLKINERLDSGGTLFAGITSLSETLGLLQGRFAESGEGLADTIARLDTATALLQSIGEDSDSTVAYFERAAMALKGLGLDRAASITAYGNTLKRINDMLSSESVLRQYELSTRSLFEVYRDQTDQIAQLTEDLNNADDFANLENALIARYDTELQLIGQIESALQSVQQSFERTIESIFIDGLETEQQRYEYFRAQADQVATEILKLSDPAQIQAAAERYNQLVGQAYQSLGEESRDLLRDDILSTITDMRDLTTELLEGVKQDVSGGGGVGEVIRSETQQALQALRQAVQDAVATVAQQQAESARQGAQLVGSLSQWAAGLPTSFVINVPGSEVAF